MDAEAACRRRKDEAKVGTVAVEWALWFVRRGITAETVGAWQAVAAKVGLAEKTLAVGLARALEEHGSPEAVRQHRSAAVTKLRADHAKLSGEVAALRRERDGITAAIGAVRDAGVVHVREVGEVAAAEVHRAAGEFATLQTQAVQLGNHVRMAQALASEDAAMWQRVEPETWAGLVAHLPRWAQARMVAMVEAEPPEAVRRRLEERARYPSLHGPIRLRLADLAAWLTLALQGETVRGGTALLGAGADREAGVRR